jgi:hypothetical protein
MMVTRSAYSAPTPDRKWVVICNRNGNNHWFEFFGRTRAAALKAVQK